MTNEKRLIDAYAMREDWLKNGENEYVYDANAFLESIDEQPTVKAVPVDEILRVIAGHSNYHGDNILSALICIAEGKKVNPVRHLEKVDAVEVVHGRWIPVAERKPSEEDATESGMVHVYTRNKEHLIVDYKDVWKFHDFISHWKPLLDPPTEESDHGEKRG